MPTRADPPPFALRGLDHVLLLVSDAGRATAFYVDVLGCAVESQLPEYGMTGLRAGASMIDLVDIGCDEGAWARPEVPGGRNVDHLCLALAAAEETAVRDHLRRHDVEIIEETVHAGAEGECLSLYVRDPCGNRIELKLPPFRDQR
jgi:glyoxylase I family protein